MQLLQVIGALILAFRDILKWIQSSRIENPAQFVKETHETILQIKEADTTEKKQEALVKLQELIHHL